jgi:hypothetical protein
MENTPYERVFLNADQARDAIQAASAAAATAIGQREASALQTAIAANPVVMRENSTASGTR